MLKLVPTMLRFRRYRAFLVCAAILIVLLYHVSRNSRWEPVLPPQGAGLDVDHGRPSRPEAEPIHDAPKPPRPEGERPTQGKEQRPGPEKQHAPAPEREQDIKIPDLKTNANVKGGYALPTQTPGPIKSHPEAAEKPDEKFHGAGGPATTTKAQAPFDTSHGKPGPVKDVYKEDGVPVPFGDYAGAPATSPTPSSSVIHWEKPTERFPVDKASLIALPTGKPKPIPSVQHRFGPESPEQREKRETRLQKVKAEAEHAWLGYKKYAWMHDEVKPVSKAARDPFCGWAATLVDALDTLWIMGLKEEFDDAVQAVKEIDFTTTPYRSDIPVFETVIRYLGGLLAAYDVSGGAKGGYTVLLDKATELAEILIGAFDTPNRMPILYYTWKPGFLSQHPSASTTASVAELGSLSMEFTRLAQLTGSNKYYDAVARITNALDDLQKRGTALPGLFPESLDASGCNRSAAALATLNDDTLPATAALNASAPTTRDHTPDYTPEAPRDNSTKPQLGPVGGRDIESLDATVNHGLSKRGRDDAALQAKQRQGAASNSTQAASQGPAGRRSGSDSTSDGSSGNTPLVSPLRHRPTKLQCVPQGLTSGGYGADSFSMGGSQDSTYEYFPKTWLLLGGLEPQYRKMHERVVSGIKKHLLYRPMVEDDRDILFSAKVRTVNSGVAHRDPIQDHEVTHLTCFLGGMFGLAGKIFESEADVEIGRKLADGCAWAYEMMPSGIMAEHSTVMPCADIDNCHWNQTAWYEQLDPSFQFRDAEMQRYEEAKQEWKVEVARLKKLELALKQAKEEAARERAEESAAAAAAAAAAASAAANATAIAGAPSGNRTAGELEGLPERLVPRSEGGTYAGQDGRTESLAEPPSAQVTDIEPEYRQETSAGYPGRPANRTSRLTEEKIRKLENELNLSAHVVPHRQNFANPGSQIPLTDVVYPREPIKPQTHEEYVDSRIKRENLKPGFISVPDPRYILRYVPCYSYHTMAVPWPAFSTGFYTVSHKAAANRF